jgi:hypothetical protein
MPHCTAVNGTLCEVCQQEEYEIRQRRVALVLTIARRQYAVEHLGETRDTGMEHPFPGKKGKGFICIYPYMRKWKAYFFKQRNEFQCLTNVQKGKDYVNFKS